MNQIKRFLISLRQILNSSIRALGYHPWEIKKEEVEANLSFICDHVGDGVALGEIGLDYKIKVKKELQWRVFEALLDIALEFNKPVIIHCRYSHRRAFEMVKEKKIKHAVFHWYSGPIDLLDKILSMGYSISATPLWYTVLPIKRLSNGHRSRRFYWRRTHPLAIRGGRQGRKMYGSP